MLPILNSASRHGQCRQQRPHQDRRESDQGGTSVKIYTQDSAAENWKLKVVSTTNINIIKEQPRG